MHNNVKLSEEQSLDEACTFRELIILNNQRQQTYSLLSRFYISEVDEEFHQQLREMLFPLNTGNEKVDAGYKKIAEYVSHPTAFNLRNLAKDYTKVFIGVGHDAHSAAFPFASVYTSKRRTVMQDARDEVLVYYRSVGLDKDASWKQGEDHIALELRFVEELAKRTVEALESDDEEKAVELLEIQQKFLREHVFKWTEEFYWAIRKFAETDFYQGLADLTEGFLTVDLTYLDEILANE